MHLLETINLTHIFPDGTTGIKDINFFINKGELVVIAGPNGAGKTIFVRHLNGLLTPTSGMVLLEGEPINKNILKTRKQIGLIFQDPNSQIIGQTVKEDIAFGPENLGLNQSEIDNRVCYALESVGLKAYADNRPYLLSGGEKRRLAIAGVLAMRPRIIILDEPFSGLDYSGVIQVTEQIIELQNKGHTLIIITHDLEKILAYCDRLVIFNKGTITRNAKPEELMDEVESFQIKRPYGKNRKRETMTWLK